jgi:hypothetical protein
MRLQDDPNGSTAHTWSASFSFPKVWPSSAGSETVDRFRTASGGGGRLVDSRRHRCFS